MNYFEFFGLPVSFHVDTSALRRLFLEKSRQYHPDFHTLANAEEQNEALEWSTLNNEAYRTLLEPDRRMRYILQLKGLLGDEGAQPPMPQDFLMEMMDINESLMELEMDFDPARYAETLSAIEGLEKGMDAEIQPVLDRYSEPGRESDLQEVRDYYLKKRYLLRIRENLATFAPR